MKILFFVSSLNAGGAERVATTLVNAWARRGDDVTLVATYLQQGDSFYRLDERVRLVRLGDHIRGWRRRLLPGISKWRSMRQWVRRTQPDVVVSFLTNVNVNVLIATLGLSTPVLVCERTNPVHSQSAGAILRCLRRLLYWRARYVVMQTQASVAPFRARVPGLRNVAVLANPLPPDLQDRSGTAKGSAEPGAARFSVAENIQEPRPHIVAMGRLVALKQFDVLINAFAQLAEDFPQWDLVIWGDGPLYNDLQQQITALRLTGRARLAGRTSRPWQALCDGQVFAMTSRVEGFPNVLLEAMALGLPCVALDCPSGPRELSCDGRDAVLVPLDQHDELAAALRRLLADAALRKQLGYQAMASVQTRYALPVILAQWDALFAAAVRSGT